MHLNRENRLMAGILAFTFIFSLFLAPMAVPGVKANTQTIHKAWDVIDEVMEIGAYMDDGNLKAFTDMMANTGDMSWWGSFVTEFQLWSGPSAARLLSVPGVNLFNMQTEFMDAISALFRIDYIFPDPDSIKDSQIKEYKDAGKHRAVYKALFNTYDKDGNVTVDVTGDDAVQLLLSIKANVDNILAGFTGDSLKPIINKDNAGVLDWYYKNVIQPAFAQALAEEQNQKLAQAFKNLDWSSEKIVGFMCDFFSRADRSVLPGHQGELAVVMALFRQNVVIGGDYASQLENATFPDQVPTITVSLSDMKNKALDLELNLLGSDLLNLKEDGKYFASIHATTGTKHFLGIPYAYNIVEVDGNNKLVVKETGETTITLYRTNANWGDYKHSVNWLGHFKIKVVD